jgi:hypothetical protein
MKDDFDSAKFDLEDLELVDLGDAAEETRQGSPVPSHPDHAFVMGQYPG